MLQQLQILNSIFSLTIENPVTYFEQQMGCDNGRREIHSDAPFGLTIWGWGTTATSPGFLSTYVSYAYPAGASVLPINEVVVPPVPG